MKTLLHGIVEYEVQAARVCNHEAIEGKRMRVPCLEDIYKRSRDEHMERARRAKQLTEGGKS